MNLKNLWPKAAATLLAVTGIANAAPTAGTTRPTSAPKGQMDPPTFLATQKDRGIFSVNADFLLWKPSTDGLDFVLKNTIKTPAAPITAGATITDANSTEEVVKGKYKPGVRVGAYYHSQMDDFDFHFDWTWFRMKPTTVSATGASTGSLSSTRTADEFSQSLFLQDGENNTQTNNITMVLDTASSSWEVKTNWFDLNMGRVYKASNWLSLRPHAGLRYIMLDQHLKTNYHHKNTAVASTAGTPPVTTPAPAYTFNDTVTESLKFRAMGLRGGMDTVWGFADDWNVYANFAATLAYGGLSTTTTEAIVADVVADAQPQTFFAPNIARTWHSNSHAMKAMTDMDIGIMWKRVFNNNYGATVAAGWEHHAIFGVQQLDDTNGNLGFSGLKISGKFDF